MPPTNGIIPSTIHPNNTINNALNQSPRVSSHSQPSSHENSDAGEEEKDDRDEEGTITDSKTSEP